VASSGGSGAGRLCFNDGGGHSDGPLASKLGREASLRGPRPCPKLQS
jgi:hypothetical protein